MAKCGIYKRNKKKNFSDSGLQGSITDIYAKDLTWARFLGDYGANISHRQFRVSYVSIKAAILSFFFHCGIRPLKRPDTVPESKTDTTLRDEGRAEGNPNRILIRLIHTCRCEWGAIISTELWNYMNVSRLGKSALEATRLCVVHLILPPPPPAPSSDCFHMFGRDKVTTLTTTRIIKTRTEVLKFAFSVCAPCVCDCRSAAFTILNVSERLPDNRFIPQRWKHGLTSRPDAPRVVTSNPSTLRR